MPWGSYVGGDLMWTRRQLRGDVHCAHAREPGRVQWTSRRAYGIIQRAVGELMGGMVRKAASRMQNASNNFRVLA